MMLQQLFLPDRVGSYYVFAKKLLGFMSVKQKCMQQF